MNKYEKSYKDLKNFLQGNEEMSKNLEILFPCIRYYNKQKEYNKKSIQKFNDELKANATKASHRYTEKEVNYIMTCGLKNKEIAEKLNRTERAIIQVKIRMRKYGKL